MPAPSVSRRLLREMTFTDVKTINEYLGMAPRKSHAMMVGQIVRYAGTDLATLICAGSAFSLAEWNRIVVALGGMPRKSFQALVDDVTAHLDTGFAHIGTPVAGIPVAVTGPLKNARVDIASTRYHSATVARLTTGWVDSCFTGAEKVEIAAGFYDSDFVLRLLDKHASVKHVRLVFNGLGGQRLDMQHAELASLAKQLAQRGRRVEIRLAFAPGMFHTKLFLAWTNGKPHALVGSANATSAAFARNEELLVGVADAAALAGYFDTVWQQATDIALLDTTKQVARSLVAFFRTGILYFKPVVALSTSCNPFARILSELTPQERKLLGGLAVPHAEQAIGIGPFNLALAVQGEAAVALIADDSPEESGRRNASIKPWAVETCFGYWVPSYLDAEWRKRLEQSGAQKKKRWLAFAAQLQAAPRTELLQKYQEYVGAVTTALSALPRFASDADSLQRRYADEAPFHRLCQRVERYLGDADRIERLSLPFLAGPIPEIWDDRAAYDDFSRSFFDYLDYLAHRGLKAPRVPRCILTRLRYDALSDGDALRLALETLLGKTGWLDQNWSA